MPELPRGVLRPPPDDAWSLHRFPVRDPALAAYVAHHWAVEWDLRGREPHEQSTLPYPAAHLVVEDDGAWLYGPSKERFEIVLAGVGQVVAVRFQPGGARPLLDVPMSEIAGERLPGATLRGLDVDALCAAVGAADGVEAGGGVIERALAPLLPADPDPALVEATAAVALLESDRSLTSVSELAERLALSVRSVQRLFAEWVGLGPGYVIRRFRLHEAAAAAMDGGEIDWARLAAELGYYDQAHLVRDFTTTIGTPPARYAASASTPPAPG